ncbi:PAS domain S-box protein [Roseomonas sp. E05]|uniref:PAS domain S-box protein n=1 Tax=Roseomonas sp. E05 TaxID=3046310 RepID=UPI0024BAAC27|nr:PAS domain S-box protein [Roseomonas sp. E05]MDJ0387007.1 PAS domain S-box protein [Roseomonas sp. E05]
MRSSSAATGAQHPARGGRSGPPGTPGEAAFGALAQLAADAFDLSMAAIHLPPGARPAVLAWVGLHQADLPEAAAFAARVLREAKLLVVTDAGQGPRRATNSQAAGVPAIRFCAGAPLEREGQPVGALCVFDTQPRPGGLSARQVRLLRGLAAQASTLLAPQRGAEPAVPGQPRSASASEYAIITTDLDGRVTGWNPGAEQLFGWSRAEMLGRGISRLFSAEDVEEDRPQAGMRRAAEEGARAEHDRRLRQDRGRFWAGSEVTSLRSAEGEHAGHVKMLHAGGEAPRTADYETLLAAQQVVMRGPGSALTIWRAVVSAAMGVIGAAESACVETPEGDELIYRAVGGPCAVGTRIPRQGTLSGRCLDERRMLLCNDVLADARLDHALHRKLAISAVIAVPVPRRDGFAAVLKLASSRRDAFTEQDAALAQLLVGIISGGLSSLAEEHFLQALRNSETRLRLMADSVPQIVWQADAEGRLDFLNRRWTEFTGLSVEEGLAGRCLLDLLHPDDVAPTLDAWREAQAAGGGFRVNHRLRTATGDYRWLLTVGEPHRDPHTGEILRWFGGSTDVDAEHRAQETIRQLKDTLEERVEERTRERDRIWRLSRDMLGIADARGTLLSVNPAWTRILGWGEAELLGRNPDCLTHPEDRAAMHAEIARLLAGEEALHHESRLRTASGDYRWVSWSASAESGLLYLVGRDVTAEKDQALALAQAEEQLRHSQKMEAVGQLTGGLAHDFNNLLAGIIAGLEMLQTRVAQERFKELDRYIRLARGAADRAAALTHRLLAFSRRQALDPQPTDLNRLVREIEELIRRTVGPAIRVEIATAADLWLTHCDRHQIENALLNLCINARDAMPDGGRLVIGTENADFRYGRPPARDLKPGQYVALRVTDTGTGMPPEVVERAFDPFYTTKPLGQGTGLGLSMVYGFARQSGGQVHIASEPGRGTMVEIDLPRYRGTAGDQGSGKGAAPLGRARRNETVLIVDDEPVIRILMAEALREVGHTVLEAQDGAAAQLILEGDARVDLLLTDVGLPGGMNGRQLADAARVRRPELKVVFITGFAEKAAVGSATLDPGMEVMTKPFTMRDLAAKIGAALRRSRR